MVARASPLAQSHRHRSRPWRRPAGRGRPRSAHRLESLSDARSRLRVMAIERVTTGYYPDSDRAERRAPAMACSITRSYPGRGGRRRDRRARLRLYDRRGGRAVQALIEHAALLVSARMRATSRRSGSGCGAASSTSGEAACWRSPSPPSISRLWDLRGLRLRQPLWRVAGGTGERSPLTVPAVGIRPKPLDGLLRQVEGFLARLPGVKVKVGRPIPPTTRRVAAHPRPASATTAT